MSKEIKTFLERNKWEQSYVNIISRTSDELRAEVDVSAQDERVIEYAKKDIAIIKERAEKMYQIEGVKVGDYIDLPDGQSTRVTHVWDDKVQTGHQGSCHLHKGGSISRSGGLDSGIDKKYLIPTDQTRDGEVWIFHQGHWGAHRGVYGTVKFNVYKTAKGADLSGIPCVEALKRQKIRDKAETITRLDGNGREYTLPLPEVHIKLGHELYGDGNPEHEHKTRTICGIKFEKRFWNCITGQPMKLRDLNQLLEKYDFKGTFYNNGTYKNTLFLEKAYGSDIKYKKLV